MLLVRSHFNYGRENPESLGSPASPGHEAPMGVMVGWDVPVPADMSLSRPDVVPLPDPPVEVVAKRPRVEGFSFSGSVAIKVSAKPWHEEDRRSSALFQIQTVVEAWPNALGLARLCRTLDGMDFEELTYSIEASVSRKATSTIVRRLSSLTHYVKWSATTSITPFPVTEKAAWAYLVHLRRTEAAWSKPGSFQQCINCCRGVLDLEVEPDFMNSPRVAGLCKGFESPVPAPKRAPALTFEEVRYIEAIAASGPNVQDVVIVGAILFMLFACARASDAARAVSLHVDFSDSTGSTVWIEAEVKKSKTAMGARSRMLLPLLVPCGIFDEIWVGHWMEAREHLGLASRGKLKPAPWCRFLTKRSTYGPTTYHVVASSRARQGLSRGHPAQ